MADAPIFPMIYCPPGVPRPGHCGHIGGVPIARGGAGPDGKAGTTYGGGYKPEDHASWQRTAAGWWVRLADHLPQHLARLVFPTCLVRFHLVQGAKEEHWWQVPVLLSPFDPEDRTKGFGSGVDRVVSLEGGIAPGPIEVFQIDLLRMIRRIPLAKTEKARNQRMLELVCGILGLTHHVSIHECLAGGWLTESLIRRVTLAAIDLPQLEHEAKTRQGRGKA